MDVIRRIENVVWARQRRKLPALVRDWPDKYKIKGCMRLYKKRMGYRFDFNHPTLFTEKLQCYKLLYDSPDFPDAVDKYLFKSYIERRLGEGYTIPLCGAWETVEGFLGAWESLPDEVVLKSTLQSDGKFIRIIRDRSAVDLDELAAEVREWLKPEKTLINSYCRAYYKATPRILAERYMAQMDDDQLYDYKAFCFDGKPHCFYVATDHFPGQLSHISFYDLNWNRLDVRYGEHPNCDVAKPKHFAEMLDIAQRLSEGIPFVRVDFFEAEDRPLLSEMTFYPGGGQTPFHPESFNRELGDLFVLPERKNFGL